MDVPKKKPQGKAKGRHEKEPRDGAKADDRELSLEQLKDVSGGVEVEHKGVKH